MKLTIRHAHLLLIAVLLMAGAAIGISPDAVEASGTEGPVGVLQEDETIRSGDADAAGKCLDVYAGGAGPWIQMWQCHGGANQDWTFRHEPSWGTYVIVNHASGQCIATQARGEQIRQVACDQASHFYLGNIGRFYVIQNRFSGLCLDIRDWGRSNVVIGWDCHNGSNQQWNI